MLLFVISIAILSMNCVSAESSSDRNSGSDGANHGDRGVGPEETDDGSEEMSVVEEDSQGSSEQEAGEDQSSDEGEQNGEADQGFAQDEGNSTSRQCFIVGVLFTICSL